MAVQVQKQSFSAREAGMESEESRASRHTPTPPSGRQRWHLWHLRHSRLHRLFFKNNDENRSQELQERAAKGVYWAPKKSTISSKLNPILLSILGLWCVCVGYTESHYVTWLAWNSRDPPGSASASWKHGLKARTTKPSPFFCIEHIKHQTQLLSV